MEKQMLAHGARYERQTVTAPRYRLVKLPTTPAKPGLIKQEAGGGAIEVEIWRMPKETFGAFAACIPSPLGIGKVELGDGTEVSGFICEAYAAQESEDITALGGWRNLVTS